MRCTAQVTHTQPGPMAASVPKLILPRPGKLLANAGQNSSWLVNTSGAATDSWCVRRKLRFKAFKTAFGLKARLAGVAAGVLNKCP